MNRIFKHIRTAALAIVLALALLLPAVALAGDGTAPVATLYSPTTNAAVSDNQKIIFRLDERVTLASGVSITITSDSATFYTADAASGTLLGNQSTGPWYVSYNLSSFQNSGTPLSLSAGTTYTVAVNAGAFVDTTSAPSEALSAQFTTGSGGVAVIFTKTNDAQSVSAGGSPILSGQAVAAGTALTYSLDDGGYTLARTVKIGGTITAPLALPAAVPSGDLELYFVRSEGTLTGTVEISGDLFFGGQLSGSVSGSNQADTGKLFFSWVRETTSGDTQVASGAYGTTYTLTAADIENAIRLDVTGAVNDGTIFAETDTIEKAPFVGTATPPEADAITSTSITLKEVSGYEYSSNGTDFSSTRTFAVASAGTTITLYQRVAQTATTLESAPSSAQFTSTAELSGTVTFNVAAQSGVVLTATLSGASGTGTLNYSWTREGSASPVSLTQSYTPVSDDIGKKLTVVITRTGQSGSVSATTANVLKAANATVPAAPTMASATAASITLNAVSGYQYSLGGTNWQDTTTFHNLAAGAAYTFFQRVAETGTTLASASSAGVNFSTQAALAGTIMASGEARYGSTLVVSLASSNNTGALTYTWKRGTVAVGIGTSYIVQAADISNQLSVEITSTVQGGSMTRSFGTVAKAYYYGDTPAAPTRSSRTTTKIVLTSVSGCEYSRDGSTWQDSTTFSGLSAGKSYTFYQRYKATATMEASPASDALKTYTSSSSDSGDSSATPTPKPTSSSDSGDGSGATTLYSYTLTSDNTRILYSTMKSLAAGNKTQDVTIKQDNVEFTFPKGTMTDSYTQLWYDFGTTINNSIAEQTAKTLAGDAYVATIHFNYSGDLPGTANIRFWLGAAHAGKTLYYYRLEDDKTLTFQQTATVDSTGWASVSQTSCSDYVFLSSEYGKPATPTPLPSASAGVSPSPTPLISADQSIAGMAADGWLVIAIVIIAVALIIGGIWLYTKSRDSGHEDDDEF